MACQLSQHHLFNRASCPTSCFDMLWQGSVGCVWLYSGLSNLFHGSMWLFLYQCNVVLVTKALQYNLKSGNVMPPDFFFLLSLALAMQALFLVPYEF